MLGPVKVYSIDELKDHKKTRKLKVKEPEVEVPELKQVASTETPKIKGQSTEMIVKLAKRKSAEIEEDIDNIIVKIPLGSTVISNPSSLNSFIKKLLLEEVNKDYPRFVPLKQ